MIVAGGGGIMKSRHILIVTSILWSSFASAQSASAFLTGNDIFQKCDNAANSSESSFCAGYIAGITDALVRTKAICLPKHFTVRQARDIVVNSSQSSRESSLLCGKRSRLIAETSVPMRSIGGPTPMNESATIIPAPFLWFLPT